MEIVCIIPARGGPKGIPGKNIMDFCGKPLLAWSILQAQQAKTVNAVYVTSNDEAILSVAEDFGATPIKRPDELSPDTATLEAALLHGIDHIEKERASKIDVVLFLQTTSPLRESEDIDSAAQKLIRENADSLFSSARLEDFFIWQGTEAGLKSINFDYADASTGRMSNPSMWKTVPSIFLNLMYCGRRITVLAAVSPHTRWISGKPGRSIPWRTKPSVNGIS